MDFVAEFTNSACSLAELNLFKCKHMLYVASVLNNLQGH